MTFELNVHANEPVGLGKSGQRVQELQSWQNSISAKFPGIPAPWPIFLTPAESAL
jgi:hypothetical protein